MKKATFLIIQVYLGISGVLFPGISDGLEEKGDRSAVIRETVRYRDLEVTDLAGTKVAFGSFLGSKPLVVVFWASWCTDCQTEVPALNRLAADSSVRLLAVNVGENEKKVRSFISSYQVTYQVVRDPGWQTTTAFKIVGVPACILLDKSGGILYRGSNLPVNIESYLRK